MPQGHVSTENGVSLVLPRFDGDGLRVKTKESHEDTDREAIAHEDAIASLVERARSRHKNSRVFVTDRSPFDFTVVAVTATSPVIEKRVLG